MQNKWSLKIIQVNDICVNNMHLEMLAIFVLIFCSGVWGEGAVDVLTDLSFPTSEEWTSTVSDGELLPTSSFLDSSVTVVLFFPSAAFELIKRLNSCFFVDPDAEVDACVTPNSEGWVSTEILTPGCSFDEETVSESLSLLATVNNGQLIGACWDGLHHLNLSVMPPKISLKKLPPSGLLLVSFLFRGSKMDLLFGPTSSFSCWPTSLERSSASRSKLAASTLLCSSCPTPNPCAGFALSFSLDSEFRKKNNKIFISKAINFN